MSLMYSHRSHVAAVVAAALTVGMLDAASGSELSRGEEIAVQRCSVCHATDAKSPSPHKITPPFRDLHQRFPIDMLVEAIGTGTVSGHDEMPMFQFTIEDAQALVTYIDSLSPENARYLKK